MSYEKLDVESSHTNDGVDTSISNFDIDNEDRASKSSKAFFCDLRCPLEPNKSFPSALFERSSWLISLLIFQSCSSYILAAYIDLLESHPSIIYFLTMLVGAGGNAGNQAAVRVIRGIAVGTMNEKTRFKVLCREVFMAVAICMLLTAVGVGRCLVSTSTSDKETLAISLALSVIVFSSILLGCVLPLGLHAVGFDAAHASTSIQVIMDILGVLLTCLIASVVLRVTIEAPIK